MRRLLNFWISVVLFSCMSAAFAQPSVKLESERERVGLVLSGGAARGLTHIGVLKALEEQGVLAPVWERWWAAYMLQGIRSLS